MGNKSLKSHNPYFNRWFSAMRFEWNGWEHIIVTILILIDGFLQYVATETPLGMVHHVTILILIDGFLQ